MELVRQLVEELLVPSLYYMREAVKPDLMEVIAALHREDRGELPAVGRQVVLYVPELSEIVEMAQ